MGAVSLTRTEYVLVLTTSSFLSAYAAVFIKDMNDFAKINEVYSKHMGDHKPARSCVEVARLPRDVLVEVSLRILHFEGHPDRAVILQIEAIALAK